MPADSRHCPMSNSDIAVMMFKHEGYSYETTWMKTSTTAWTPWRCSEPGCPGKVATSAFRSKLWQQRKSVSFTHGFGGRRMAIDLRQPHNHSPQVSSAEPSPTLREASELSKKTKESSASETHNTPSACNINIDAIAVNDDSRIQVAKIPEKSLNIDRSLKERIIQKETPNEQLECLVCSLHFSICYYHQHVQTIEHKTAIKTIYKDRIDFKKNLVFSTHVCTSTFKFFFNIEKDFITLVKHMLLEVGYDKLLLINVKLYTLFHEESFDVENKNIAEVKNFDVHNLKITKETDMHKLFAGIVKSVMMQSDDLKKYGWTLEEIVDIEIIKLEPLKNIIQPEPLDELENEPQTTDEDSKTLIKSLQCKTCSKYVFRKDYQQHLESISHKVKLRYSQNANVLIIESHREGFFSSFRILFPRHDALDNFFNLAQSIVLDVVEFIMKLHDSRCIHVNIQLCALYNDNEDTEKKSFGHFITHVISNEVLFSNTPVLKWYQQVMDTLKSCNNNFLNKLNTYFLKSVLFLELQFYELIDISDC